MIPQVLVVGSVVVIVSQTISFLDPTVEPHFREMNISPEYVSIVFLLLSAAYTITSPIVGWFSGLVDNKFPIMALGLLLSSCGLLLLGPSFLIPLDPTLLMSIASMALIGVAYAIAFIPTFEAILDIAL
jgi:MFS family permease